jgi:hypothetical protein
MKKDSFLVLSITSRFYCQLQGSVNVKARLLGIFTASFYKSLSPVSCFGARRRVEPLTTQTVLPLHTIFLGTQTPWLPSWQLCRMVTEKRGNQQQHCHQDNFFRYCRVTSRHLGSFSRVPLSKMYFVKFSHEL